MEFRRLKGSDTWHFCRNCSNWPTKPGTFEKEEKRKGGELCDQCLRKKERGECEGKGK